MSGKLSQQNAPPLRGSARLEGEPGRIAPSDLLAFAENLVRDASPDAQIASAAMHILEAGASTKVTGEAACLSQTGGAVWRVSIADETGTALSEITLTLTSEVEAASVVPIATRRSADADDRRTRIALAARDVFAEKGYTAATMREIAAAAGMHVPTMYQYFRSKEEILELVYSWTISQAVDGMKAVLSATGPAVQRMDAIVRHLHEVNAELRRGTRVMNRETRSLSRAARDRVLGHYAGMIRNVGDVIADGQDQGVFRPMDPHLAAVFVDALADVWVLRPFAVGDADPETYAAELVAFVRGALTGEAAKSPGSPAPTETD
jgi:AcrR family transcriptional regulator